MSKVTSITISRGLNISSGYDMDKPFVSITVDLEDGENPDDVFSEKIGYINQKLVELVDSENIE